MMRPASLLALLVVVVLGAPARSADWQMDLFSYFRFVDQGTAQQIAGGTIPVEVGTDLFGTWTLSIPATRVTFAPIVVSPEEILDLSLASNGSGQLSVVEGEVHATLNLALAIKRRGYGDAVLLPLRFTTATAVSSLRPGTSIRGAPLDPGSGFVQLVAVAEEPWSRPPLVGRSFEVVLSGRLMHLPENLINAAR
jgi:hypothetical protein